MVLRRVLIAAACAIALCSGTLLSACGNAKKQGVEEPAREGLSLNMAGVDYNVFITRELNLKIQPDEAYYHGPEPKPGFTYYGLFIQACNNGKTAKQTIREFRVTDNQDNEFEPIQLPPDNAFAYTPRKLMPKQCIPAAGSVAQQGPAAGSLLLFEFPLASTENRPLELELRGPFDILKAKRQIKKVELDL